MIDFLQEVNILMIAIEKIEEDVKKTLSEFRYNHSLMVANEAKNLAKHYNYDEEKAYLTGMTHDIAKEFTDKENQKIIEKYHLSQSLRDEKLKEIIHADIGAIVAKERYNVDEEISNAIKFHTIGNINMSLLDKIIFVADKIAREKKSPMIEEASKVAYQDLDRAVLIILESQKQKLENKGKYMHKESEKLMMKLKNNVII